MPDWTQFPEGEASGYAFRVMRTPAKGSLVGLITTSKVLGCRTHFLRNRTVPCEGEAECSACRGGYPWRWHGYVACILYGTYEHVIFEFTAAASDSFKTYFTVHETMRGCKFTASRPSGRTNGRITIGCKRVDEQTTRIPDEPDLKRLLCHLWNIQDTQVNIDRIGRPPFNLVDVKPRDGDGRN